MQRRYRAIAVNLNTRNNSSNCPLLTSKYVLLRLTKFARAPLHSLALARPPAGSRSPACRLALSSSLELAHSLALSHARSHSRSLAIPRCLVLAGTRSLSLELARPCMLPNRSVFTVFLHAIFQINPFAT